MNPASLGHPRRRGGPRHGITLIEILVVIVLISILAGITASRLDWTRYRADSWGRILMSELAQAQRTAVSLQTDVRVTVVTPVRVRVHEDANNNGVLDGGERVTFLAVEDGFSVQRGSMAALPAPAAGTELTAVTFRRDGTANTSGAMYLRSPASDATCRYCRAAEITRATGRVVLFSHATGTWVRAN